MLVLFLWHTTAEKNDETNLSYDVLQENKVATTSFVITVNKVIAFLTVSTMTQEKGNYKVHKSQIHGGAVVRNVYSPLNDTFYLPLPPPSITRTGKFMEKNDRLEKPAL